MILSWVEIINFDKNNLSAAISFATHIHGHDETTQILRRNLIRYMVLTQSLVLRDISLQVRKRFPTLDTLVAAGILK